MHAGSVVARTIRAMPRDFTRLAILAASLPLAAASPLAARAAGSDEARGAPPATAPEPAPNSVPTTPPTTLAPNAPTLGEVAGAVRARHGVRGLAVAIVDRTGLRSIAADGDRGGDAGAIVPDDAFHLGSCTKAFTATLAAALVADGRLRWNSTIGEVFGAADAGLAIEAGWRDATLEELLRHRGGAPAEPDRSDWMRAFACGAAPEACRAEFVAAMLARPPAQQRGTPVYSNQGYAIAGRMIELAGGAPYEAQLASRVLAPLGIARFGFGPPSRVDPAAPRGHAGDGALRDIDNPSAIAPAGTLHMPLGEWAKFVAFHLGAAPPDALAGAARELEALHRAAPEEPREALGWRTATRPWGGAVLHHAGSNTMWFAVAWLSPSRGFAVLAASNQGGDAAAKACDEACAAAIARWSEMAPAQASEGAAPRAIDRATDAP
ncbi:MAG: hypothetical protein RI967_1254 [Planctomycetota bacterium]